MSVLFISPRLHAVSETFIARHAEYLRNANALAAQVILSVCDDETWRGIPVYSLGRRRLRPKFDRAWRSVARRVGVNSSSWYSYESTFERMLVETEVDFDRVLIEYADTAYHLKAHVQQWLGDGIPVFIHLHGHDTIASTFPPDYIPELRHLAERGAVFISNSEYTASTLGPWQLTDEQLTVKCYGVEIPQQYRKHHPDNEIAILHLGRLVDFKAPHLTLQAFERACERGLRGTLVVAGDGELRARCEVLREQSRWKDRITLLGAVDWSRANELRLASDVFTLHSIIGEQSGRIENLGVAVLEAMAAGLPVVTCPMGGIKETVIDGETGVFFPSGDVEAQAEAFLHLACNPALRAEMGRRSRERIGQHFSVEREKRELLSLLGYSDDR